MDLTQRVRGRRPDPPEARHDVEARVLPRQGVHVAHPQVGVRLYESLGFLTLGIAPGAFRHPTQGIVGLRIMWLDL